MPTHKPGRLKQRATPKHAIIRNKQGVPLAEPPVLKHTLANFAPPTGGEPHLEKERVIGQVEVLLLKGITRPSVIASILNISLNQAKNHVEAVHYRWAFTGNSKKMHQLRGEAAARLDLLTGELWQIVSNADSDSIKLSALSQLMGVHDRRMLLDGLTGDVLALLRESSDATDEESIEARMANHQEVVRLGSQLLGYLEAEYIVDPELAAEVGAGIGEVQNGD